MIQTARMGGFFMFKFLLLVLLISISISSRAQSVAAERLNKEHFFRFNDFVLLTHKQNYLLPATYNFNPNNEPYETLRKRGINTGLDRVMRIEAKFQLSFKFPIGTKLFTENDSLWIGYTQLSFWQVYNQNSSRPFRESNYEPELFYMNRLDWKIGTINFDAFTFGYVHQSNGQTEFLSRAWDRIYVIGIFSFDHFALTLKPWVRISEGKRRENADIQDYLGHFEMRLAYHNAGWTYSLMLRNVLKKDYKGYREFSASYPIRDNLKGFFQYVNGYGESMLDYKANVNRFGLGVIISDLL